ncbi:hypothetical protein [Haloarcula litorea]|uniref:hypothetical protein n=1 Tax=Haloarcula litorea TaxID=3032579 RepID=UPI0023E7F141|nr:hypothetical protein [Halomicroarcula sp. GDY20]
MSDNSNSDTDSTDTKTLVIDADELARAHVKNMRQREDRDVKMMVRWKMEWEGEQHAKIDWYDTSLYTKSHRRAKPRAFLDSSVNPVNAPDENEVVRRYAEEHGIEYNDLMEIWKKADEEEIREWIDECWEVYEDGVRGAIVEDEERLRRWNRRLEDVDEVRFE